MLLPDLSRPTSPPRLLVTGAGGPAAVSFLRSLADQPVELFAVDIDPYAAGLHLVPDDRRALVPRGDDPSFVDAVASRCADWGIDLLVPTVECELEPLSGSLDRLAAIGVTVLIQPAETLAATLDKWALADRCRGIIPLPATAVLQGVDRRRSRRYPAVVKPRRGSGSQGVHVVPDAAALATFPADGHLIVQEHLPGPEYSVDVLVRRDGTVVAAVPRERLKVDSGVAVTARTLHHPELEQLTAVVARHLGMRGVANVQWRLDRSGRPRLLEVNPRLPGTMPLTVASGVHMPAWLVAEALGAEVPAHLPFREVAVVRHWEECFVDPAALRTLEGAEVEEAA